MTPPAATGHRLAREGGRAAREAAESSTVDRLGQFGILSRALVVFVIAGISVDIAIGGDGHSADSQGALQAIAARPFGLVVLWLVAAGFLGHAVWRFLEAATGLRRDSGTKRTLKRLWFAVVGCVYIGLCVLTLRAISGRGATSSDDARSQQAAAGLLGLPGGRVLTFVAGLGVIGVATGVAVWALQGSFLEKLHIEELGQRARSAVRRLGTAGQASRAGIVAFGGFLLVDAALEDDASRAQGLDGTLRTLAGQPYGAALLLLSALGLTLFGVYSIVEALLLRTTHDDAGGRGR
jgi:hypothetical protein